MDYKETIKKRIGELPEPLKDFVLNENWRRNAEQIGREFSLNEKKYASLENEIFLVLLCFEPKEDFAENLKQGLGLETYILDQIVNEVHEKIFSDVYSELEAVAKEISKNDSVVVNKNKLGESFEQVILNQARGMIPAKPAEPAGGIMNHGLGIMGKKDQAPENLPSEENSGPDISVPNYSKNDPYREPIE